MKVLIIGSGGREHALAWKLAQSKKVSKIYSAPGNPGMASLGEVIPIKVMDLEGLLNFALKKEIDLTFVGPEAPLVAGIVDLFEEAGLKILGPNRQAAQIEGSKAFAKEIMEKYSIPTGRYQVFTQKDEAKKYIKEIGPPCVVKMDGIAAGKGVIVAKDLEVALKAVDQLLPDDAEGKQKLLVEEFLEGEEITVMAFTDGKTVTPMIWAQDHKRVFDGDEGPNTGGMGAYSPTGLETPQLEKEIYERILLPTIKGLAQEGSPFKGILYAGLILTKDGPKVLEFNARFGDPESQVIIPRLETDLMEIADKIISGDLASLEINWSTDVATCVILASGGYPGEFPTGYPITGLDKIEKNTLVFQGGTKMEGETLVTAGGRVLGITGLAPTLEKAIERAYTGADEIRFKNRHLRVDIGWRALKRGGQNEVQKSFIPKE